MGLTLQGDLTETSRLHDTSCMTACMPSRHSACYCSSHIVHRLPLWPSQHAVHEQWPSVLLFTSFFGAGYWSVDAKAETAMGGVWKKGPGLDLFKALDQVCSNMPHVLRRQIRSQMNCRSCFLLMGTCTIFLKCAVCISTQPPLAEW